MKVDRMAYSITRVLASLDDDPWGTSDEVIIPQESVDLLREVHQSLHAMRRETTVVERMDLEYVIKTHIESVLELTQGKYAKAARILKIDTSTLYRMRRDGRV